MSSSLDAVLSRALAIRLNLQISLSSLPIVEEWMDVHLNRWLESVPLPPEMPMGHDAHFAVVLSSDLGRMAWRAHGNPTGFVPKMAKYFESCRMTNQDMMLLDQMGEMLEPQLVGSWIAVADNRVHTGWQFTDAHPFAAIEPLFAEHAAKDKLLAWLENAGVDKFRRFSQAIGDDSHSELEFPVAGVSVDDQLAHVSSAFVALTGEPLPEYVNTAMSSALSPEFAVAVRIRAGAIAKVSVLSPGLGNDVISELCRGAALAYHSKLPKLQGALGAQGADCVEYARFSDEAVTEQVDIHLIPTDAAELPIKSLN